ncbi:MAG: nucleotidyltransferase domain-containing protein [Microbacteriaceae bacterium]
MNTSPSALFPLFRSDVQGRLLAAVLLNPEHEETVSELVLATDSNIATVLREVDRLVTFGLFKDRRSGKNRYISAEMNHPLYPEVRRITEYSYGPQEVLRKALELLEGISEAYIYGSWADRSQGAIGRDPQDIDVLVVGAPNREEIYQVARDAEKFIRKDVNIRIVDNDTWEKSEDVFLRTVRAKPLVKLLPKL